MIKESEEKYLASQPDRIVRIAPFDPKAEETGKLLVKEIQALVPDLKIYFWGAAALGIAGQNDIDIDIFSTPNDYPQYRPILEQHFGVPSRITKSIRWEFKRNGFDVEVFLTDANASTTQDQLRVFQILSADPKLRAEYEQIKLPYGEQDYKTYMRRKFEFFNRILGK